MLPICRRREAEPRGGCPGKVPRKRCVAASCGLPAPVLPLRHCGTEAGSSQPIRTTTRDDYVEVAFVGAMVRRTK